MGSKRFTCHRVAIKRGEVGGQMTTGKMPIAIQIELICPMETFSIFQSFPPHGDGRGKHDNFHRGSEPLKWEVGVSSIGLQTMVCHSYRQYTTVGEFVKWKLKVYPKMNAECRQSQSEDHCPANP